MRTLRILVLIGCCIGADSALALESDQFYAWGRDLGEPMKFYSI